MKSTIKWKLQDVFNVFVVTFAFEFILFIVIHFTGLGKYVNSLELGNMARGLILLLLYLLQIAGFILPLWFFILRRYESKVVDFGFYWIGTWKTILWTLIAYLFYIGLSLFIIMIFFSFGIGPIGFEPQKSLFEIFGNDWFGVMIASFVAVILAPFVEEVFFRGFVLQTLVKRISVFWGVVLTALIFASIHFEFQSIIPLIVLSFILNILYVKTKSIWPGIVFHIFNNTIAFIAMYIIDSGFGF